MVLAFPLTVIVIVASIIRDDFLEVKALAREIMFDQNASSMLLLDNNMLIIDYNEAAKEFFSRQNVTLRKTSLKRALDKQLTLLSAMQSPQATWVEKFKDGKRYFEISTTYIKGSDGSVYGQLKTIHDITDYQLLTSNLKIQATIDELSGVLNRRAFIEKCRKRLNGMPDQEFALFMIDVDNFKKINDTFGHMTGDRVIKELGAMLGNSFRKSDVIGRLGGDEFAVFIRIEDSQIAKVKADKLIRLVHELTVDEAHTCTVSIGVAVTEDSQRTMEDLLKQADIALYASKAGGRNKATLYDAKTQLI
jgi:diguanylate cyclase (GGDEF)-like protein